MPVIIEEVVISVDVGNEASGGAGAKGLTTDERQRIVTECVERVMEILQQKRER